ncbi:MAG: LppM family (lipo)protein, partial [Actinomycetota bacterium]
MRRFLFGLAVMALALSACELRAEIAINEDGSGTVGMVFAVEPQMLQFFNQTGLGADPFAELRSDLADDPVAWEVDEFNEGSLNGIRAVFSFASVDDLIDKMAALDGSGGGEGALKDFTIARRGNGWVFEGRSADAQEELSNGQIPIPLDQLATMVKVQFRVTLPGKAASHNADEVTSSGGRTTFIWKPDITSRA